jgi:DNA invertase Pin-like site-specific DNA recombinase
LNAAFYARISTAEGKQHAANQIAEILTFAERRGWPIVERYIDEASGARANRDALAEMLLGAHQRKFDVLIVWALDRLTREGIPQAFDYVAKLNRAGVEFVSVTEPQFSSSGGAGEIFVALAAWFAKQERIRLQERINAGLARARSEGTRLGRKPKVLDVQRARDLMAGGNSLRQTAILLGVDAMTLHRRLARA